MSQSGDSINWERYARHLPLPAFGREGQQKLAQARVLVVGAGGLGNPVLSYLAAAGVGTLGIVDGDEVSIHNLQRQVLFKEAEVGQPKVMVATNRLQALNSDVEIIPYHTFLNRHNALEIMADYELIVDATDNLPARYLISDACVLASKVGVYGAIYQYEGQLSVWNALLADGSRGPNYRDLFPVPPAPEMVPDCASGGVLGALTGIIGSMQAVEVVKILTGVGEPLAGKLFVFDASSFSTQRLQFFSNPQNPLTGIHPSQHELIDYEAFCGTKELDAFHEMSPEALHMALSAPQPPLIVDVREPYEYELVNIGGLNIPLGELGQRFDEIPSTQPIVVLCKSGVRSAHALGMLQTHQPKWQLSQLAGGLMAYIEDCAPELPKY